MANGDILFDFGLVDTINSLMPQIIKWQKCLLVGARYNVNMTNVTDIDQSKVRDLINRKDLLTKQTTHEPDIHLTRIRRSHAEPIYELNISIYS